AQRIVSLADVTRTRLQTVFELTVGQNQVPGHQIAAVLRVLEAEQVHDLGSQLPLVDRPAQAVVGTVAERLSQVALIVAPEDDDFQVRPRRWARPGGSTSV